MRAKTLKTSCSPDFGFRSVNANTAVTIARKVVHNLMMRFKRSMISVVE